MGRTRNQIEEILAKKERAGPVSDRFTEVWNRLESVIEALQELVSIPENAEKLGHKEVIRYFPIALTACLEGYVRRAIQDLIDTGKEYRENIRGLKNIKFELESVLAIEGRTVTVGEFVAHNISISQLAHIDSHLSAILGEPFMKTLKVTPFSEYVDDDEHVLDETVFSTIEEMFKIRHIFCHEITGSPKFDIGLAYLQLTDCASFISAIEKLLVQKVGPTSEKLASAKAEH